MTTKIFWIRVTEKGIELPCRLIGLLALGEGMEVFYSETDTEIYFWTKNGCNYKKSDKVYKVKLKNQTLAIPYQTLKKYVSVLKNGEYVPCVVGSFDFARIISAKAVCHLCGASHADKNTLSVADSTLLCPAHLNFYETYIKDSDRDYGNPWLPSARKRLLKYQSSSENFRGYLQMIENRILALEIEGYEIATLRDSIQSLLCHTIELIRRRIWKRTKSR